MPYAHSLENRPKSDWETMAAHEELVAWHCRQFLRRIDPVWEPWGTLLGHWHDLGKYDPEFQAKLEGERTQVDHAAIGALLAAKRGKAALPAAFVIAGHHTGLANFVENGDGYDVSRTPLRQRLKDSSKRFDAISPGIPETLSNLSAPTPALPLWLDAPGVPAEQKSRQFTFFTRMLFSALVDADRLATAEFYSRAEGRLPEHDALAYDPLPALRDRLDAHIDRLTAEAQAKRPSAVNALRAEVLATCRASAAKRPGLFSLTVPTGGAKTLSGMSFALRHAALYGLDRVIVIIPFTSIIEQNAKRYREALGSRDETDDRNVLEHHSGIDEKAAEDANREAELKRRLAAENWDAPIIVSTAVQFFESLFSDHPARCRKLHRIAKSVIVLDEVQTLPPALLLPILEAIKELTDHYGCTVVLSTATPPALSKRETFPWGLPGVEPIVGDAVELAARPAARRVEIQWRVDRITPYAELAQELAAQRQVLVVVHRRQDARTLAELLPAEGRFHLSALMCPAHRLEKLSQISRALKRGAVCRVVSTQLIEAGVDIDLPVVYRALAGLDSLVQSAGRCDREGKRSEAAGRPAGRFVVFRAETLPPSPTLRRAMESTETLLGYSGTPNLPNGLDPFNPDHCELFFRELYGKETLDARHIQREAAALNFANVGAAFRMIDDAWSRPVVVPWGDGARRIDAFREEPCRAAARALQPFTVQVSGEHVRHLLSVGAVEQWENWTLYLPAAGFGQRYSNELGLIADPNVFVEMEVLMV